MHRCGSRLCPASSDGDAARPPFVALEDSASGAGRSVALQSGQRTQWVGTVMVLGSAAGFAPLAIFAKLAYGSGLGTEQTLAFRFLLAAIGMWVLAIAFGQNPLQLRRDQLLTLLALGGLV